MEFLSNIYNYLVTSYWFSVVFKIFLGVILCGAIGLERQSWNKPAGFKTHIMLGLCGVFVMLISEHIAMKYGAAEITRIPAQLLSGLGFIGAGAILKEGFMVKGITTAAGLLAVTIIGMAVGAGFYLGATIGTLVIYILLAHSGPIVDKFIQYMNVHFTIQTNDFSQEVITNVKDVLSKNDIIIAYFKFIETGTKKTHTTIKIKGKHREGIDINNVVSDLMTIQGVTEVVQEMKDE